MAPPNLQSWTAQSATGRSGPATSESRGRASRTPSEGTANNYVKQSLLTLITSSQQGGGLDADTLFRTGPYSNSYSSWTLDAVTDYYRNTGDTAFAQQILPWLEGQLAYDATLTNSDGLIVTGSQISTTNGGYDWDFYDGAKTGVVTAFNDLYYRRSGTSPISKRASVTRPKRRVQPDCRQRQERDQRQPLQPRGGHLLSQRIRPHDVAQDANALSVLFGIAPDDKVPGILSALKTLWGPHGSEPYSGSTYSNLISPFITAFEVEADYAGR